MNQLDSTQGHQVQVHELHEEETMYKDKSIEAKLNFSLAEMYLFVLL